MKFPLLDLKAQYAAIQEEIETKVAEVLRNQAFILGAEVEALENELGAYIGAKEAVGVSSGSDALIMSLMALGIKNGDCVVTSPFTFFATGGAIARLGAKPVFCDIDSVTYNIDPESLRELLEREIDREGNSRIRGIVPVHLYGQCADMTPINGLADRYGLFVLEDAAQAVGSEYPAPTGTKRACTLGDAGILSFYPAKNLGACGDAGMVLTNDSELGERLRLLRVHGSGNKYYYEALGGNFRLDALQAAVLRVKLKHLDAWQQKRQEKAASYDRLFAESGLLEKGFLQRPEAVYKKFQLKHYHTYHQYVVRVASRDALQSRLKEEGVPSAVFYPLPLHLQKCFAGLGYKKGDFPEAEKAALEVLALPIYPELKPEQQESVVESIRKFYSEKR
ncbi:MAG: DegT/DnrJ/EryC1/StrS family aminotransferase [Candidatus Aminicenantes bacterium]|nr:DegT/DnrJ/EryC1/StrS family aminotransferase [Candidatus Aminicenantes bacterium]